MYLEFRDFVKISPNFDVYLETLEGVCTSVRKSRKSKIAKNELKHTQTITEVHMKSYKQKKTPIYTFYKQKKNP